ncbi:DUF1840 domain-containing protein [Thioalkalivibrio sp.]|uniref:DUF1840 domain-containing protein n=1 Tax=Thioalkalivibrio sp. TaxID=2093813 RepID=UPI003569FE0C
MLVTFRTPAYSDITMFGDVALALIQHMGHSPTVPSAIAAEDVPQALERLRAAIDERGGESLPSAPEEATAPDVDRVSLAHRALPLMQLLEAAEQAETYVMWDR